VLNLFMVLTHLVVPIRAYLPGPHVHMCPVGTLGPGSYGSNWPPWNNHMAVSGKVPKRNAEACETKNKEVECAA